MNTTLTTIIHKHRVSCAILFIGLFSCSAYAQIDPVGKDRLAIGGYDVVSYFVTGQAAHGNPDFKVTYKTIVYQFVSEANKETFHKNPEKYLPQYDGWCALAVGVQRKKVNIDPETFKITDGKLYLFFNSNTWSGRKFNSLEPWVKDEENLIKKSDANWIVMTH